MNLSINTLLSTEEVQEVTTLYKEVFGESNWEEGKKCTSCGKKYRLSEAPAICCAVAPVDFYSDAEVASGIKQAMANTGFQIVRLFTPNPSGFAWGWQNTLEEINNAKLGIKPDDLCAIGAEDSRWFYLSELGVRASARGQGYGRLLLGTLLATLPKNIPTILRTSTRSELFSLIKKEQFSTVYAYGDEDDRILSVRPA